MLDKLIKTKKYEDFYCEYLYCELIVKLLFVD